MQLKDFEITLSRHTPPERLPDLLTALWHERRGDWNRAHEIAQDIDDRDACWVHAYLHRREGDAANAAYWYRRAGRAIASGDMDDEWRTIAETLLRKWIL